MLSIKKLLKTVLASLYLREKTGSSVVNRYIYINLQEHVTGKECRRVCIMYEITVCSVYKGTCSEIKHGKIKY